MVPDILDALNVLREAEVPMALVHDEYGHFEGVVTPADILDALRARSGPTRTRPNLRPCSATMARGSSPAVLQPTWRAFSSSTAPQSAASPPRLGLLCDVLETFFEMAVFEPTGVMGRTGP